MAATPSVSENLESKLSEGLLIIVRVYDGPSTDTSSKVKSEDRKGLR
jgi:hypothetical protein